MVGLDSKDVMQLLKATALGVSLMAHHLFAQDAASTNVNPAKICMQAFAAAPVLSVEEDRYLDDLGYLGNTFNTRAEELLSRFDKEFFILRQVLQQSVDWDWGSVSQEKSTKFQPDISKCKSAMHALRARVKWNLVHGRQFEAKEGLLASLALAKNAGRGSPQVISALAAGAMERIVIECVVRSFFEFNPETLEQIALGFKTSRARLTIQQGMRGEKALNYDLQLAKVRKFEAEHPDNNAATQTQRRALMAQLFQGEEPPTKMVKAKPEARGSLLQKFLEVEPYYAELDALLALPERETERAWEVFNEKAKKDPASIEWRFVNASLHRKARNKEFVMDAILAMFLAGIEYRLHGEEAFKKVRDPFGDGPFRLEPLVVKGVDRGFVLKSKLNTGEFDEALVFATNAAPPVIVSGSRAGQVLEISGRGGLEAEK